MMQETGIKVVYASACTKDVVNPTYLAVVGLFVNIKYFCKAVVTVCASSRRKFKFEYIMQQTVVCGIFYISIDFQVGELIRDVWCVPAPGCAGFVLSALTSSAG